MAPDLRTRIDAEGFAVLPRLVSDAVCERLRAALDAVVDDIAALDAASIDSASLDSANRRAASGGRAGRRDLLRRVEAVCCVAASEELRGRVRACLGAEPFAVRGIFFDKTPAANWRVAWHQDLTIAVAARREVPGFGPWSVKEGAPHVQPPAALLERMLAVRIHLDDAAEDCGPLRLLPGSHRHGRLSMEQIEALRAGAEEVLGCAAAGGGVLMRPLVLHASSPAERPTRRRVVHLEYAAESLPGGLEWFDAVGR